VAIIDVIPRTICVRFLSITEPGSFHLDPRIAQSCLVFDFGPYMLAFSITIRPYEQSFGKFSLLLDVFRNAQFFLHRVSIPAEMHAL
jgi:hypothetical protein